MASRGNGKAAWSIVQRVIGRRLSRAWRVSYLYQGQLERDEGALQLQFDDGAILLLDGDAAGELLRVSDSAWCDPFAGPQSSENVAFIREHGRWMLIDVSDDAQFRQLIGRCVESVSPLTNRFGSVIGVQLKLGEQPLNFYVSADECFVTWGMAGMPRWTATP